MHSLLVSPFMFVFIHQGFFSFRYRGGYDKVARDQLSSLLHQNEADIFNSEVNTSDSVLEAEIAKLVRTFESEEVQRLVKGVTPGRHDQKDGNAKSTCCVVCRLPDAKNRCSRWASTV